VNTLIRLHVRVFSLSLHGTVKNWVIGTFRGSFPLIWFSPPFPLTCCCAVIEEQGVRLKLTVTDTPGFGDQINNDKW